MYMMNTFNMNVEKANNLVEKVWNYEFSMPHKNFLNGWAKNKKSYLAEIFGGELILSKEVTIEQSVDAMYIGTTYSTFHKAQSHLDMFLCYGFHNEGTY